MLKDTGLASGVVSSLSQSKRRTNVINFSFVEQKTGTGKLFGLCKVTDCQDWSQALMKEILLPETQRGLGDWARAESIGQHPVLGGSELSS